MELPSTIHPAVAFVMFMLGFGFIIFVHELGHFLVAKWAGIKCTQFALGFGGALFSYRKGLGVRLGSTEPEHARRLKDGADPSSMGETEYRLNWMPLGGYVKMVGQEDMDATALSEDPRAFNKQSIGARLAVVGAGVVMNAIFAVIFFIVAFLYGVDFPPARIGFVAPGMPAAVTAAEGQPDAVGLRPGDQILQVNGDKPTDFTDLMVATALSAPGSKVEMVVRRPAFGDEPERNLVFRFPTVENRESRFHAIGIGPASTLKLSRIDDPEGDKLLREAGLEPLAELQSVNGTPVDHHWQIDRLTQKSGGKPMEFVFKAPGGKTLAKTIQPTTDLMRHADQAVHMLGLVPMTQISTVMPKKPADGVLEVGDVVMAVNQVRAPHMDLARQTISESEGKLKITVLRQGQTREVEVTPKDGLLGVVLTHSNRVGRVLADSPFAPLNLPEGTLPQKINDTPIQSMADVRRAVEAATGDSIRFTYQLPLAGGLTETKTVALTADHRKALASLRWLIDQDVPFQVDLETQIASSAWNAVEMGVHKTHIFMLQTYITLARLAQGRVKLDHLRGPVGIMTSGTKFTEKGWPYMLFFLGLISISVAVFNFLPLPVVDGGLAVLLLIEKIRGRPVPPGIANAITMVGLVLLGTLALVLTYKDIMRDIVPWFTGS
jgi:regulator of sigma E protease